MWDGVILLEKSVESKEKEIWSQGKEEDCILETTGIEVEAVLNALWWDRKIRTEEML